MFDKRGLVPILGAAGLALCAMSGLAMADGEPGSVKDAPVEEGRKFTWSFTLAGTSDYVFRGISQTREDPAFQPQIDVGYGIFYAGVWASTLDFGEDVTSPCCDFGEDAQVEIDVYAGIKPVWGPVTFDFGVLGYFYPSASDDGPPGGPDSELDYVEFKAGYSTTGILIPKLTTATNLYYSPEYTANVGETLAVESTVAYELPKVAMFTPTVSGLFGTLYGDDDAFEVFFGDDEYHYWNVGLSLAVEKFIFDFRYWDTELKQSPLSCQEAVNDLFDCGERFVFTTKVTLP